MIQSCAKAQITQRFEKLDFIAKLQTLTQCFPVSGFVLNVFFLPSLKHKQLLPVLHHAEYE